MVTSANPKKNFVKLARKRTRQLTSSYEDVVKKSNPEVVHDFREITRHLQSMVEACGGADGKSAKKIRKRLQRCRHALSDWRDGDVMLRELTKARRTARSKTDREWWALVIGRTGKVRDRAIEEFYRTRKSLKVRKVCSGVRRLIEEEMTRKTLMRALQTLIQNSWERWNESIDGLVAHKTAQALHSVRIKTKTLRYALELGARFYPEQELTTASRWLKRIQERIGSWHDQFALCERARESFTRLAKRPDQGRIKLVERLKAREIGAAVSGRNYIISMRKTELYQRLHRRLSASIFAMSNDRPFLPSHDESLSGPLS